MTIPIVDAYGRPIPDRRIGFEPDNRLPVKPAKPERKP